MTKQNTPSATNAMETVANQIQSLFNPQGNQDIFKTWARMSERMTAIVVEAGTQSTDIMSNTTKEALSNLADATQVRDEPAEYSKAYSDFAQKQMDLLTRAAQDVGEVTQKAGTEATSLASKASEELKDEVAAKADDATDKAAATAKHATDKATETTKDATEKGAAISAQLVASPSTETKAMTRSSPRSRRAFSARGSGTLTPRGRERDELHLAGAGRAGRPPALR